MIVDVHSHVMQAGDDSLMAMNPVDISDASTDVDHSLPFRNSSVNNFDSLACISHGLVSVWFWVLVYGFDLDVNFVPTFDHLCGFESPAPCCFQWSFVFQEFDSKFVSFAGCCVFVGYSRHGLVSGLVCVAFNCVQV